MNHVHGVVHTKLVQEIQQRHAKGMPLSTGKKGRPKRPSACGSEGSQTGLHSFFRHAPGEILTWDKNEMDLLMCWGLRGPVCLYGGKSYSIDALLFDPHVGKVWYPEPYLEALLRVQDDVVIVKGSFRHRKCKRISLSKEPFPGFTCSMCAAIVFETDFKLRVIREEHAVEKHGSRGTGAGRRVGYLSLFELTSHSRTLAKKLRLEKLQHWSAKTIVAQLKMSCPTLKESAQRASSEHNVFKFCSDIIAAHRTGAMGGKPALWDFLREVASNLNRKKQGVRWSTNSKAFSQAMKMFGVDACVTYFR